MELASAASLVDKELSDISRSIAMIIGQAASRIHVPRVFIVLTANNHLYFEAFDLVEDSLYVRRRHECQLVQ